MPLKSSWVVIAVVFMLASVSADAADTSAEERSLTELRNTVISLLQALVDKGVLTREQAQAMVRDAEKKAEADVAAAAAQKQQQQKEEEGAVRVPYVPEIVRDQIAKDVVAELGPSVMNEVVQQINTTGTLRAALPDWVQRMNWMGDIRLRGEANLFASGNAEDTYLDFNQVNAKGGISKAGPLAFLNTTEDRERYRVRVRFGFDTTLGSGFTAGVRLATGSGEIFPSTNQTLGTYGSKYQITFDQAYIRWSGQSNSGGQLLTFTGGRFSNPFLSSDLVWYNDLTFEGLNGKYRLNTSSDNQHRKDVFLTLGAFPLQQYSVLDPNPFGQNKWLAAGQLGVDLNWLDDVRLQVGAAYYDFVHMVGQKNQLASTLTNFTAPGFFQHGNTVFDISNTNDPTVNLFALAADYRVVDATLLLDWRAFSGYSVGLLAQAVRNVGYNTAAVSQRTGVYTPARTDGYRADIYFGSAVLGQLASWRAAFGYRYLQRDAVVDAFNDEDFHLGGTDAKGYTLTADFYFNPHVWMRAKYLSANEIDGPPFGIDVVQLDLNAQF